MKQEDIELLARLFGPDSPFIIVSDVLAIRLPQAIDYTRRQ